MPLSPWFLGRAQSTCSIRSKSSDDSGTYLLVVVRIRATRLDQAVKVALGLEDLFLGAMQLLHVVLDHGKLGRQRSVSFSHPCSIPMARVVTYGLLVPELESRQDLAQVALGLAIHLLHGLV